MARPTVPPSRTSGGRPPTGSARVDVRGWLGGVRLSGFMVIMLGLVVLAAFVLVPTVGTYLDQRQQIAALQQAVAVSQSAVDDLQEQQKRWTDPAYITTQARERLYYVKPGEVVYLVDDDLPDAQAPQDAAPVSDEVAQTRTDWMSQLVRSVATAGLAQTATQADGVFPPGDVPTDDATPAP